MADLVERLAPVQGYSAGIPWSMHLRAYDAYCKRYSPQKALIEGGCRGGFGVDELDLFIPGWREELSEITALRTELETLRRQLAEAERRADVDTGIIINTGDRLDAALEAIETLTRQLGEAREAAIDDCLRVVKKYSHWTLKKARGSGPCFLASNIGRNHNARIIAEEIASLRKEDRT